MAAFTVIDQTELTGTTVYWEKTSIPSSYHHLLLKASIRGTRESYFGNEELVTTLNGSTDANDYSGVRVRTVGATSAPTSDLLSTGDYAGWGQAQIPCATGTPADMFGFLEIWIPHNANTTNFKQVLINSVATSDTTSIYFTHLSLKAGVFHSTDAIDEIKVTTKNTGSGALAEFSSFTLYGVTGA